MTARPRPLPEAVRRVRPDLGDPVPLIEAGLVEVDGFPVTTPRSSVRPGASIVVRRPPTPLRGSLKLGAALDAFGIEVAGSVAVDVGAAAGGFTRVLLEAGASLVYAVDAGHGQLRGSLRQDARVVNLESTNVARLDLSLVPRTVDIVTVDVSYLSLAAAAAQLGRLRFAPRAALIGLVKPMFELRLPTAPTDRPTLDAARRRAEEGLRSAGWVVVAAMDSPVEGARGARELLLHARRAV